MTTAKLQKRSWGIGSRRALLLHDDRDFDLIADVTGQETRWIIPRGTGH